MDSPEIPGAPTQAERRVAVRSVSTVWAVLAPFWESLGLRTMRSLWRPAWMGDVTKRFACVAGVLLFAVLARSDAAIAAGIPLHAHGPDWVAWEADSQGVNTVLHQHDSAQEEGDTAHNHYLDKGFGGWDDFGEQFSAFGVWIDRTAYVEVDDGDLPGAADEPLSRQFPQAPHGWISSNLKPRYKFIDGATDAEKWETDPKAKVAKPLIEDAFDLWSGIQAHESPVTDQTLQTGFGFQHTAGNEFEIEVKWKDFDDASGGGRVLTRGDDGTHNSANTLKIEFDNSFDWDFGDDGFVSDPDKWHFLSVALHEVGHLGLLEHQNDADLMDPPVGRPLDVALGSTSHRFDDLVNNPGENDFFSGTLFTRDVGGLIAKSFIEDNESIDGIKSLYSIAIPEPSTFVICVVGMILLGGGYTCRRFRRFSRDKRSGYAT